MKSLKSIGLLILFFSLTVFIWSCGGHSAADQVDQNPDATHTKTNHGPGKAYTASYVCPMHCEGSGSEEPVKCPECGMDYVAQADHTTDGHSH